MKKTHQHTKSMSSFQMTMTPITSYSDATPSDIFDLRCEYEVPRYFDLNNLQDEVFTEADEEEFFKWFQISHDFKINRRFVKVNKDALISHLPPKIPTKPTHQQSNNSISQTGSQQQSAANNQNIQQLSTKHSQVLSNGSQTDRTDLNVIAKARTSRNQMQRTQSQMMQSGSSKLQKQPSIDLNSNSSFYQQQQQQDQSMILQKLKKAVNSKASIGNVSIDLSATSTATRTNLNLKSALSANYNAINQQYTERSMNKEASKERNKSKSSRVNFIKQNMERVKIISAQSKNRAQSREKIQIIDKQAMATNNMRTVNKNDIASTKTNTNHQTNQSHTSRGASKSKIGVSQILHKVLDSSKQLNMFDQTINHSSAHSKPETQQNSTKRKKNGRVNSLMWTQTLSTNNLLKNQTSMSKIAPSDEDYQIYSSRGAVDKNTHSNQKQNQTQEKENLIQSQYLKQLMKLQSKNRYHQRNQSGVQVHKSYMGALENNNYSKNTIGYNGTAINTSSTGTISRHKSTNSFSKNVSNSNLMNESAMANRNNGKQRDPLVSQISLNNL